jgi:hypothetical protein
MRLHYIKETDLAFYGLLKEFFVNIFSEEGRNFKMRKIINAFFQNKARWRKKTTETYCVL